jgi:hypothetical protein
MQRDDEIEVPYAVALAAVIKAEIDFARAEMKPGSTLTRSLETYDDGEARVSIFITTTLRP